MIPVLRVLHILSGAFWYGAVVFVARFLIPSLRATGPAAGAVMAQLEKRRLPVAMMGASIVNLASGIWLMFLVSGGALGVWMRSPMGRTLGIGGGFAVLAMIVGMAVNLPATQRLGHIATGVAQRGGAPSPEEAAEVARLQQRMGRGAIVVALLLSLTVAAMAVARYL